MALLAPEVPPYQGLEAGPMAQPGLAEEEKWNWVLERSLGGSRPGNQAEQSVVCKELQEARAALKHWAPHAGPHQ